MVCSTPQTVSNHLISTTCKMLETGLLDLCSVKHQHSPIAIKITASHGFGVSHYVYGLEGRCVGFQSAPPSEYNSFPQTCSCYLPQEHL